MSKNEIRSAGGFGESRTFAAEEGTFEAPPVYHMNGLPIPPELAHAIPFANTDEGIAERMARPGPTSSGITVTGDETDTSRAAAKFLDQTQSDLERGKFEPMSAEAQRAYYKGGMTTNAKPWDANSEMRRLMEVHRPSDGHRMRWKSDRVTEAMGLQGYQPVNDGKGGLVRFGASALCSVPADVAAAMERDFADKAPTPASAIESHVEQMRTARVNGSPAVSAGALAKAHSAGAIGLQEQRGGFRDES